VQDQGSKLGQEVAQARARAAAAVLLLGWAGVQCSRATQLRSGLGLLLSALVALLGLSGPP
jgi:hypothetical protein